MLRLTEPEDLPTEEYDPDYSEDLGDDLPGAMPHPISYILLHMLKLEMLVLYLLRNNMLLGCMVV
jgi:hypothetical protein